MVPRTVKQPVKSKLILGLPKTEDTKFSLPVTKGLFFYLFRVFTNDFKTFIL